MEFNFNEEHSTNVFEVSKYYESFFVVGSPLMADGRYLSVGSKYVLNLSNFANNVTMYDLGLKFQAKECANRAQIYNLVKKIIYGMLRPVTD